MDEWIDGLMAQEAPQRWLAGCERRHYLSFLLTICSSNYPAIHSSNNPTLQSSLGQGLVQFLLVEEAFFGLKGAGVNDPELFPISPIDAEDAHPAGGVAEVKEPGLDREAGRIGQEPNRKGVFERFFDFLQSQRAIEIEGRIGPIKLHKRVEGLGGSIVFSSPMQCRYIVFTWVGGLCQGGKLKKLPIANCRLPIGEGTGGKGWPAARIGAGACEQQDEWDRWLDNPFRDR